MDLFNKKRNTTLLKKLLSAGWTLVVTDKDVNGELSYRIFSLNHELVKQLSDDGVPAAPETITFIYEQKDAPQEAKEVYEQFLLINDTKRFRKFLLKISYKSISSISQSGAVVIYGSSNKKCDEDLN
jgi:hypothetical protein